MLLRSRQPNRAHKGTFALIMVKLAILKETESRLNNSGSGYRIMVIINIVVVEQTLATE